MYARAALFAIFCAAVSGGTAAAGGPVAPRVVEDRPPARNGAAIAVVTGGQLVDDVHLFGVGVELEGRRRVGPVVLVARARLMRMGEYTGPESAEPTEPMEPTEPGGSAAWDSSATAIGPGLAVRVPVSTAYLDSRGGHVGLWAEAGVGQRFVRWDAGGRLRRNEISLGIGFDGGGSVGRGERPHQILFGLSVRAVLAGAAGDHGYDPGLVIGFRVGWQR